MNYQKIFKQLQAALPRSKKATNYLKSRHLYDAKLEIGSNHQAKVSGKTGYLYPKLKNCVVFPLKDKSGKIVSLYGRSINGTSKHFYTTNRKGLYPKYPSPDTKTIVLTESIIDAATINKYTDYWALALYGTNGLNTEHIEALTSCKGLQEMVLFFDGDSSGVSAAEKYAKQLRKLLRQATISQVSTPEGEDPNSLVQSHQSGILTHLIQNRKKLFFLSSEKSLTENSLVEKGAPKASEEKKKTEQNHTPKLTGQLDTSHPEKMVYENEQLCITIWGGVELDNLTRLKISLFVQSKSDRYKTYRDEVNLYSHASAQRTIRQIAETLELPSSIIAQTLTELTEKIESYRMEQRAERLQRAGPKTYLLTPEEKDKALKLLHSQTLAKDTARLIAQSGLVGEKKNGLLLFFLYLSRLMEEPLHAIIFGQSGSGKTYLQTKISDCLPEESVRTITSLTENTLYYSAKDFWKNKVLLIEDLDGIYNAFLPLRELMSKQNITKFTTDKDSKGNNAQKILSVEGPVCVSGATTKTFIYEDNANRSFLLHTNESSQHLSQVMRYQREERAGLIDEHKQTHARTLLKNAQRLLKKRKVVNPYALELSIPDCVFKKLRTNLHYLKLIEIVTFYHQYQRKKKTTASGRELIETSLNDIEIANELVKDTLLRKSDELSGQLRQFFEELKNQTEAEHSFYAKQIRQIFRMHPMKVNRYLRQLESMGYVEQVGGNRKTGFEYQIRSWEEYDQLKSGIDILDEILQKLKAKQPKNNEV